MRFTHSMLFIAFAVLVVFTALAEARESVKRGKIRSGKSTWFEGHHLKDSACYGILKNKRVDAKDHWHIGAVHMKSYTKGVRGACFECVKITANRRSVIVRIIDDCATCAPNQIDLTSSAFKILAPLKQGIVKIKYEFIRCPSRGSLKWPSSPAPK
ncbi:MAG: RlpA-like double-psi beta-barrel-protein domain-containing protein-containing protein [Benniella sp.]|nr:MAG: RlpA-like double-psi beta-barrel-protein domain-containing protein-containing protein [Benniella sp.]